MRAPHWTAVGLLVVAVVAFVRFLIERQESAVLHTEVAVLRQDEQRVAQLRGEHERLIAGKVSDAELQRLRADRAALVRLRNEINQLEGNADRMGKGMQETASGKPAAQLVKLSLANDGGLSLDGAPIDQTALRQHLAKYAGGTEPVEISLHIVSTTTSTDILKATVEGIVKLSKELGLKFSMRFEKVAK
jgi:hypothetical protein